MKIVDKKPKEKKKTMDELTEELQVLKRHLYLDCKTCDGTGKNTTDKASKKAECKPCYGTGMLESRLVLLEATVEKMKREINRLSSSLRLHLNKQSVEIRVLEDSWNEDYDCIVDGTKKKWGDYSGTFNLDSDEEMGIVIDKARTHFNTYFKDGFFHSNKTLGIFLSNPMSGKRLIEEITTEE